MVKDIHVLMMNSSRRDTRHGFRASEWRYRNDGAVREDRIREQELKLDHDGWEVHCVVLWEGQTKRRTSEVVGERPRITEHSIHF